MKPELYTFVTAAVLQSIGSYSSPGERCAQFRNGLLRESTPGLTWMGGFLLATPFQAFWALLFRRYFFPICAQSFY